MRGRLLLFTALLLASAGPLAVFSALQGPRLQSQLTGAATQRAIVAASAEAATLRSRLDTLRVTAMLLSELAAPGNADSRVRRLEEAAAQWLGNVPEVTALKVLDATGSGALDLNPVASASGNRFQAVAVKDIGLRLPKAPLSGVQVVPLPMSHQLAIVAPLPNAANGGVLALMVDTALLAREVLNAYWVTGSGDFLHQPVSAEQAHELPGLPPQQAMPAVWHDHQRTVAWTALPLDGISISYVGREVEIGPVQAWRADFYLTFVATLGLALFPISVLAWHLSGRGASLRKRVASGLKKLLDGEEVRFRWPGRGEFALLAQDLNAIAQRYRDAQAAQRKSQSDLTQQRDRLAAANQQALARTQELETRLASLPDGVLIVGTQGEVEDCNGSALRILGFTDRAALLGEDFHERLMHSRADGSPLPARRNPVRQAMAPSGSSGPVELALWGADGEPLPVSLHAIRLGEGEGSKALLTFRDLREEKRREVHLAAQRRQLEQTLSSLPDAVLTLDTEGTIVHVNPETERLTGWPVAEATGQPVDEVVRLDGMTVLEALAGGDNGSANLETLLERRDSGHAYVRCVVSPLVDADTNRQGAVVVLRDLTGSPPRAHETGYQSTHDLLTGLVNRREIEGRLGRVLDRAWKANETHALLYLDLDDYGALNQHLGTIAGDVLLRQVASLLRSGVRGRDTVARVGADEFAVLLEHCSGDQALRVAASLREAIRDFRFHWGKDAPDLSACVGVLNLPHGVRGAEVALAAGETACLRAKERGRNRVEVGGPEDAVVHRQGAAHWVQKLNEALEQSRFRLFCQSIVPLRGRATGEAPHYELLLRMVDDAGELKPAGSFLPMAARYNMIAVTDRWVTRTALEWLATRTHSDSPLLLEINLAQATVADESFAAHVQSLLDETSVPPSWVCFQFSAAAATAQPDAAARLSRALKRLGCMVALDDFGAECSSYGVLRELKVDFIKIAAALVKEIPVSPLDRALVHSVVEVARVTGRHTIAKAVENDAILDAVRELGVDFAQGYGVSRPRPLEFLKAKAD